MCPSFIWLNKEQRGETSSLPLFPLPQSRENFYSSKKKLQKVHLQLPLLFFLSSGLNNNFTDSQMWRNDWAFWFSPSLFPLLLSDRLCPQDTPVLFLFIWFWSSAYDRVCLEAKLLPTQIWLQVLEPILCTLSKPINRTPLSLSQVLNKLRNNAWDSEIRESNISIELTWPFSDSFSVLSWIKHTHPVTAAKVAA